MKDDYELAHNVGAVKLADENGHGRPISMERDEADLMRLGKKPVLKVSFHQHLFTAKNSNMYCSEDLDSCHYWALAVQFSSLGRAY